MKMAILNSDSQVTIPTDIIKKLGIEVGDKIFFVEVKTVAQQILIKQYNTNRKSM